MDVKFWEHDSVMYITQILNFQRKRTGSPILTKESDRTDVQTDYNPNPAEPEVFFLDSKGF